MEFGYFETFNFLIVESQIIATLIGFEAILFIFWYREKIKIKTLNGKKKFTKKDKNTLKIIAIIFLWIILMGCSILIEHADTLYQLPLAFEDLQIDYSSMPYAVKERLDSSHQSFIIWTILSFLYIGFLIISLDVFDFLKSRTKIELSRGKNKTNTMKKKENVNKNKKSSGGK